MDGKLKVTWSIAATGPRAWRVEVGRERDQIQSPHSTRRSFESNAEVETDDTTPRVALTVARSLALHHQTDHTTTLCSLLSQVSSTNTHLGGSAPRLPYRHVRADRAVLLPFCPSKTKSKTKTNPPRSSILDPRSCVPPPLPQILFDPHFLHLSHLHCTRITVIMGKVHGSLARAGKVKQQVSGVGVSVDAIVVGQGWEGTGGGRKKGGMRRMGVVQRRGRCGLGMESSGDAHMDWGEGWWIVSMRMRRGEPDVVRHRGQC